MQRLISYLEKIIFYTCFFHAASSYALNARLSNNEQYDLISYFENAENFTSDNKNQVYYTANNTLFREGISLGKPRSPIANFYVSPDGNRIYIATKGDGLFISKNGGFSYRLIWEHDLKPMRDLHGVYVSHKEEIVVIAKEDENALMLMSKDGETWREYPIPIKFKDIKAVHVDRNIKILADGPEKGLLLVSDNGYEWQFRPLPLKFDDIAAFHFGGHKIYLGTNNQRGGNFLMISEDEGQSFKRPNSTSLFHNIKSILSDSENNVYIVDRDGFEKNVEDFNHWERRGCLPWKVIEQLFERDGNIYAITSEGMLFISYGKMGPVYGLDIAKEKKFQSKTIHVTANGRMLLGGAFASEAQQMNNPLFSPYPNEFKNNF